MREAVWEALIHPSEVMLGLSERQSMVYGSDEIESDLAIEGKKW
jgi:hypothetical protein